MLVGSLFFHNYKFQVFVFFVQRTNQGRFLEKNILKELASFESLIFLNVKESIECNGLVDLEYASICQLLKEKKTR
jgi:hypothetical protein